MTNASRISQHHGADGSDDQFLLVGGQLLPVVDAQINGQRQADEGHARSQAERPREAVFRLLMLQAGDIPEITFGHLGMPLDLLVEAGWVSAAAASGEGR